MTDDDLVAAVDDALAVDRDAFQGRVDEERAVIEDLLRDGAFDNPQGIVGLEYEFYAVARDGEALTDCALMRVPRRLLEFVGFEKELGLHNAEMTTSPQPFNASGLRAQVAEVGARLQTAQECVEAEGMRLVSDAMWTIPPAGESATEYLTDSIEDDGVRVAPNMSDAARYHAMANTDQADAAGMALDAPNVSLQADTVMPESLITSIQPHYQVAHAADLPTYFNYAVRVAGPLLALGANSPFFPPDLYDDGVEARTVVEDAWMEHRISVFETVLNAPESTAGKVRFPRDLDDVTDAVDRIAEDTMFVPMPVEDTGRFDDQFAHFRHKHGTYWRWVRPVFGGPTRSAANARIEFRPIPAQPTVRDSVAFQAAFAGLLESLPALEHPVGGQDWETARDNFYAAMRDGVDADLVWRTQDGYDTTDHDTLYADLLDHAEEGLRMRGLTDEEASRYVRPLRVRARRSVTPATWKVDRVEERLAEDASLAGAIRGMQREYVDTQTETLLEGTFEDWLDDV
jgi:hypothetical protein